MKNLYLKIKKIIQYKKRSRLNIKSLFDFLHNKNCVIKNEEEIINFLNNHIVIIDYLYEAPEVIKKKFGDVKLNLELYSDPERDDEETLFLNIETDLSLKIARDKLNEIDKEWLVPKSLYIENFNIDLEFI